MALRPVRVVIMRVRSCGAGVPPMSPYSMKFHVLLNHQKRLSWKLLGVVPIGESNALATVPHSSHDIMPTTSLPKSPNLVYSFG